MALQRPVAGFTAGVTYALVDTEVVTNLSTSQQFQPGQPLLRRPKHSGTVRVGYAIGQAERELRHALGRRSPRQQLPVHAHGGRTPLVPSFFTDITVNPGYAVAGFGVDYQVDRTATVFVRVNNVGDTEYDSALGYPGLPRSAMVGVRFNVAR